MSQVEWFYELLGQEFGPVSQEQLRDMVADNSLSPSDRIRPGSDGEWTTVAELPDDDTAGGDSAGELTDLSELSFSFESAGNNSETPTESEEPDIDAFNLVNEPAQNPVAQDDTPINDVGIDSFNIEGDTDSALPPPSSPQLAEFYVDSLGQILGPMPLSEVAMMAESGALSDSDRLKQGDSGEWCSPSSIPEIAAAIGTAGEVGEGAGTSIGAVTARRLQSGPQSADDKTSPADATDSKSNQASAPSLGQEEKADETSISATKKQRSGKSKKKKKGRKKKEPKKDELLQEIFSEVFTEDGKVDEDRLAQGAQKENTATTESKTDSQNPAPPPESPASSQQPATPAPPPPVAPPQSAVPAPTAQPRPMPRPPVKKKSGGGFSMPPPKVLGMIGGGLAVLLIVVAVMTGTLSMPGLAPDVDGFLNSVSTEYKKMSAGPIPEDKWMALRTRVKKEGRAIITHYAKSGNLSPEDNKKRFAVAKLIELLSCDPSDTEKIQSVYSAYESL